MFDCSLKTPARDNTFRSLSFDYRRGSQSRDARVARIIVALQRAALSSDR
jgi:hypothetical protein